MADVDYYEFPYCMHALAAAMHRENINPGAMEIALPFDEWWRLWNVLERKFRGMMRFDGRGDCLNPAEFQYMGFKFVVKKAVDKPNP
jgi:hypothetical protein